MSAQPVDPDELSDLLPDDLQPGVIPAKAGAVPVRRTPKQIAAAEKAARDRKAALEIANAAEAANLKAQRLAQIVNLHIGGYSLSAIGAAIGASEAEVDRMLSEETARYVRTQPALRTYVRNYISSKYAGLLEATYTQATDKNHSQQLEYVDRVQRVLAQMGRLHGAEAPTQTEIKVEAAPEAVDRLVQALASGQGLGYDADIFDAEVLEDTVQEVVEETSAALVVSGNAVEESDGNDDL